MHVISCDLAEPADAHSAGFYSFEQSSPVYDRYCYARAAVALGTISEAASSPQVLV